MPSPYRESDDTPRAPLDELEWRRRVTKSAGWAELLVVGEVALLRATQWLPPRLALSGAVAWWVIGGALAVATWIYTAPRSRSAVGWWGWLLRASVPLYLGVAGLLLLGMHMEVAGYILGELLGVAAIVYGYRFGRPRRGHVTTGKALLVGVGCAMVFVGPPIEPEWRFLGFGFVACAASAAWALRGALLPVDHEWWFDNQRGTPGEWVSLLVCHNQYAQMLFIDGRRAWFRTKHEALLWLEDNGYVPAERALAEHLVESVPPDVLPLARRRRRLRIELNEPRVRVVPDTSDHEAPEPRDGAVDELEDAGLPDEAPPRRATAVHERHDRD